MSEFNRFIRNSLEVGALGTAVLALAGCGGDKSRFEEEFVDGVRIQRFHPENSGRILTEVVQLCDNTTMIETTTDIGFRPKNGKKVYGVKVNIDRFDDHDYCKDGKVTPEDTSDENDTPTPVPTVAEF